jgi:hypothetical protein
VRGRACGMIPAVRCAAEGGSSRWPCHRYECSTSRQFGSVASSFAIAARCSGRPSAQLPTLQFAIAAHVSDRCISVPQTKRHSSMLARVTALLERSHPALNFPRWSSGSQSVPLRPPANRKVLCHGASANAVFKMPLLPMSLLSNELVRRARILSLTGARPATSAACVSADA